jgi:hypothetical protein
MKLRWLLAIERHVPTGHFLLGWSRVTRLGEILPMDGCLLWEFFLKITKITQICGLLFSTVKGRVGINFEKE